MTHQAPITLSAYDPNWPAMFEDERAKLALVLAPWLAGPIEHIGSSAVPGLCAKPIIDIMAGVIDLDASRPAIPALAPLHYQYWPYKADVMHWFCKPNEMARTHHLHLVPFESPLWSERLAFRDALRSNSDTRTRYGALKTELASQFANDREAYTEAKTAFIANTIAGRG